MINHGKLLTFIAANVRARRRKNQLTQERLAAESGFDIRTIQRVERAELNMTLSVLVDVANALDVEPAELFRSAVLGKPRRGRPW